MSKRTPRQIQLVPQKDGHVGLSERFGGRADSGGRGAKLSWADANPIALAELVGLVVESGGAVMFGVTRDGGACVLTVFDGDDKRKWYPDDERSMKAAIEQVSDAYRTPEQRRALVT